MKYAILCPPDLDNEQLLYKLLYEIDYDTDCLLISKKKKTVSEKYAEEMAPRLGLKIEYIDNPTQISDKTIIIYKDNTYEIHTAITNI